MSDEAKVKEALRAASSKTFREAQEHGGEDIVLRADLTLLELGDGTATIEARVSVSRCEEHDQESARIIAQEGWVPKLVGELETELGVTIDVEEFGIRF